MLEASTGRIADDLPADCYRRVVLRAAGSVARAALSLAESQKQSHEVSTAGSAARHVTPDRVGEPAAGPSPDPPRDRAPRPGRALLLLPRLL